MLYIIHVTLNIWRSLMLLNVVFHEAEAEDCCLATVNKRIPHRLVKTFYIQTRDMGCRIQATV